VRPFCIALIASASGLLILFIRSIYCLAARTGQAKKEYGALLSSGLMSETEESGLPAADPVLSGKLKSAMDEAKSAEGSGAAQSRKTLPDADPLRRPESPATSELSDASPATSELSAASITGPLTGPLPPPDERKPYVFKGRGRPSESPEVPADGPETRELRL
jgi:hypothetical protein